MAATVKKSFCQKKHGIKKGHLERQSNALPTQSFRPVRLSKDFKTKITNKINPDNLKTTIFSISSQYRNQFNLNLMNK